MKDTTEILLNYALYHEWVSIEIIKAIEKSKLMSEEMIPHLQNELAIHNYWLNSIKGIRCELKAKTSSIKELAEQYIAYHDNWKNLISELNKEDFSRLIKFSSEAGHLTTHTLIDLLMESFRQIEKHQNHIATVLENNYRKRLRLSFLEFRQRINTL